MSIFCTKKVFHEKTGILFSRIESLREGKTPLILFINVQKGKRYYTGLKKERTGLPIPTAG